MCLADLLPWLAAAAPHAVGSCSEQHFDIDHLRLSLCLGPHMDCMCSPGHAETQQYLRTG